jgi:hypothetical protein
MSNADYFLGTLHSREGRIINTYQRDNEEELVN